MDLEKSRGDRVCQIFWE